MEGEKALTLISTPLFLPPGQAACWLLLHVLTADSSTLTTIDWFQGSAEHSRMYSPEPAPKATRTTATTTASPGIRPPPAFRIDPERLRVRHAHNIHLSGSGHKVTIKEGRSGEVLRTLPLRHYDVIYVDGSHTARDVLQDAVLGWGLLKRGGLMIFDDYLWVDLWEDVPEDVLQMRMNGRRHGADPGGGAMFWAVEARLHAETPRPAIDAFVRIMGREELEVVHRGNQLIVRKSGSAGGGM